MLDSLSPEDVLHIARLARLKLSEQQLTLYQSQLNSILEHVHRLTELPLDEVEPLAHPLDVFNELADDLPSETLTSSELLANAPAIEQNYFAVPKVLDSENSVSA